MKYINSIILLVILFLTSDIYCQSKLIGFNNFTIGQNFDEIEFKESIQWNNDNSIGMIWEDPKNTDGNPLGIIYVENSKIIGIDKNWGMKVNPMKTSSLFNVIWDVCGIVFGERTDNVNIAISEIKEPTHDQKDIEIFKFNQIDDKYYLYESVKVSLINNNYYSVDESAHRRPH